MKATEARPDGQVDVKKPCIVCGTPSLPWGNVTGGHVCSKLCQDRYDAKSREVLLWERHAVTTR